MTRQFVVAILLSLGFGFEGADGALASAVERNDGSLSVHGGLDEPLPTPGSQVTPKKTPPLPPEVAGGSPRPAITTVPLLPTEDFFRPFLLGFGVRLGRSPPRA